MPPKPIRSSPLIFSMDCDDMLHGWRGYEAEMTAESIRGDWRLRFIMDRNPCSLPVVKLTDPLTPCARDVLATIPKPPERMTKPQICAALESARKFYSERSVSTALKLLIERKLIVGPRRGSSDGYQAIAA